ncbi:hypothetical protein V1525DRAFT_14968 [Lipomyces kononenkoae]|uniref:Uncharacterized protein n=1 Tax=Lipomyces kononenkoae TaxID=34357 RepID=A0ACC3T7X9_LIPKO
MGFFHLSSGLGRPSLVRLSSTITRTLSSLVVLESGSPSYSVLTAASKVGGPISVLLAGSKASAEALEVAKVDGVAKVLTAPSAEYDHSLPEKFAPLVVENVKRGSYTHVFAPASAFGKNVVPRAAAILDVQQISDITAVQSADTFVRPIYAGNVIATVKSKDPIKFITVRTSAFPDPAISTSSAPIEDAVDPSVNSQTTFVSEELTKTERPDLGSAKRVVSGGRGLKDKESFDKIIYPLADALGAAVGASRAAVDSGFADNSLQVGQTGKVVAPDLYLAVGISGAIQHLAGMKDSKTIVAINKDADAPIFEIADIGLVADLFDAIPELTDKINKLNN